MNVQDVLHELDGYFQRNEVDQVEPFLQSHLAEATARGDQAAVLTLLNELMGFYRGMSRFREAIAVAEQAVTLLEELGYKGSIPYATTLLNAATAYRADGQIAKALALYEEVTAIYAAQPVAPYLRASLYNNLSLAYQAMAAHAEAIRYLELALPLIREQPGSTVEVAVTLTNLAQSKLRSGRAAEAKADLEEAVRLFESQAQRNPHYGAALAGLGEVAYRASDLQEARTRYEQALAEIAAHYGKNLYYAVTLASLAVVYETLDPAQSRALAAEAEQIQQALG